MRHILMRGVFYKKNPGYRSLSFKKVSFLVIRSFFILFCCTYCDGSCDGSSFERKDGGKRSPDSIGGSLSGQGDPDSVGVLINEGADYTRNNIVQLTFDPSEDADQMLISSKADCSGGTWESLKTNKLMELSHLNAENTVYVKYRFMGEEETQCVSDSIIHDNIRPEVSFVNPPGPWSPASLTINLNARDTGSGIDEIQCDKQSTGHFITCGSSVSYHSLQSGDHSLVIRARDKAGNLSVPKRVDWKVAVSKQVNHEVQDRHKMDILFIVDTSISMDRERNEMAKKINGFISQISHLDWQIAATTTTVYPQVGDGNRSIINGINNGIDGIYSVERNWYDRCLFNNLNNLTLQSEGKEKYEKHLSYADWSNTTSYPFLYPNTFNFDFNQTNAARYGIHLTGSPSFCTGVLTDNPYKWEHDEHSEGRFTDFTENGNNAGRILSSSVTGAQDLLGNRIQAYSQGGFPNGDAREQGIHAAVKAIQRYNNNESPHTDFFRDGADLVFIVLADEDENSIRLLRSKKSGKTIINTHGSNEGQRKTWASKTFRNPKTGNLENPQILSTSEFNGIYNYRTGEYDTGEYEIVSHPVCPQCPAQKFQEFVETTFGSQKKMVWHSIIKTDTNCSNDQALHAGYMYEALSDLTDGVVGDVCVAADDDNNYTRQLREIGSHVASMSREITLDCEPVDINGDGRRDQGDVEVLFRTPNSTSYGVYPAGTYSVNGRKLVFSSDPSIGQYKINYNCSP